jgi:hypothetical protein
VQRRSDNMPVVDVDGLGANGVALDGTDGDVVEDKKDR